jgi:hypothetical protein
MKTRHEQTKQRVLNIAEMLEDELGIGHWWVINHHFVEGFDGDTEIDNEGKVSVYTTGACTTTSWEYRVAKITWYLSTLSSLEDFEIAELAIHEYVHVLNAPICQLLPNEPHVSKLEEFVTESLARVIIRARGGDGCPA